ncbi:hypothetical protein [Neobacillus thermocopriae]|uniref:Uncharacterized protein n=1 Tax=Neobacillus thermocopriae TaxID=1215031 RepID=A0A6B3TQ29_9BACI|nr:hypothetical protein [Neobacillus thermocopriae]NEX79095.1 hypothetical protein [Neobacillus thermocopriae]
MEENNMEENNRNINKIDKKSKNKLNSIVDTKDLQCYIQELKDIENKLTNINEQVINIPTIKNKLDYCHDKLNKLYQEIREINKDIKSYSGFHTYINKIYAILEELKSKVSEHEKLLKQSFSKKQLIEKQTNISSTIQEDLNESSFLFKFKFSHLENYLMTEPKKSRGPTSIFRTQIN